jgi:hypothetical protein
MAEGEQSNRNKSGLEECKGKEEMLVEGDVKMRKHGVKCEKQVNIFYFN